MAPRPARPAARPGRWRRGLRLWHRWFGLASVVWLLALGLTGSPIVFYDALDTWLNPDWRTVAVDGRPLAADAAIRRHANHPKNLRSVTHS